MSSSEDLVFNKVKKSTLRQGNRCDTCFMMTLLTKEKSSPTVRGGSLGGVIENDFLICRIYDSALIHSQSPNQKVEAAGVDRRRRSRNTFENKISFISATPHFSEHCRPQMQPRAYARIFVVWRIEFTLSRHSHKKKRQ